MNHIQESTFDEENSIISIRKHLVSGLHLLSPLLTLFGSLAIYQSSHTKVQSTPSLKEDEMQCYKAQSGYHSLDAIKCKPKHLFMQWYMSAYQP